MQGTIVNVLVEEGSDIEVGDPICVLEAMKMENNVMAEKSGILKEVMVSKGDSSGGRRHSRCNRINRGSTTVVDCLAIIKIW